MDLLLLDEKKPWLDIRVQDLTIDGEINDGEFSVQTFQDLNNISGTGSVLKTDTGVIASEGKTLNTDTGYDTIPADPTRTYTKVVTNSVNYNIPAGDFDLSTGIFTIPKDGVYEFTFSLLHYNQNPIEEYIGFSLRADGVEVREPWLQMKYARDVDVGMIFEHAYKGVFLEGQEVAFYFLANSVGVQGFNYQMYVTSVV